MGKQGGLVRFAVAPGSLRRGYVSGGGGGRVLERFALRSCEPVEVEPEVRKNTDTVSGIIPAAPSSPRKFNTVSTHMGE